MPSTGSGTQQMLSNSKTPSPTPFLAQSKSGSSLPLSGQVQTTYPHACPRKGRLCCKSKMWFQEFTAGEASELLSCRVLLVPPECQDVATRQLSLRLSKMAPADPAAVLEPGTQSSEPENVLSAVTSPWGDGASSVLAQSIHQEKGILLLLRASF